MIPLRIQIILCHGWALALLGLAGCTPALQDKSHVLSTDEPPGKALFAENCSQCHERGVPGAPMKSLLMVMSPNTIYNVLTKGAMQVQASRLSDQQRSQIIEYLTGSKPGAARTSLWTCTSRTAPIDRDATPVGTGWGIDAQNTRSVSTDQAGLAASDLHSLKLQWVFSYPDSIEIRSQPVVVGRVLFAGSQSGAVYALDARSGCVYWTFQATGEIRGGMVYRGKVTEKGELAGGPTLFFGDVFAHVYAIDAVTGVPRWTVKVDDHPAARIVGTPVVARERVYVPLGSWGEEIAAASPDYVCCTFRGSLVALDRATGATVWKRYTIPTPAVEQYKTALGKPHLGPSGAGIWSSPAFDEKRGSIYFTTGNNYSDPADDNSDAIFSVDAETGSVKWKRQTFPKDTYNDGCGRGLHEPTCPKRPGPDVDFTAPPILLHGSNGQDILLAGQKSGDAFGLDPDTGAILWHTRISQDPNPFSGAIWFGMTAQADRLIVPMVSLPPITAPAPRSRDEFFLTSSTNGLHAIDAFTGKILWSAPVNDYCEKKTSCVGVMMAPLAIPGAVLSGSVDGYVRAFDDRTGKVLWTFDTGRPFKSLNGDTATGGAVAGAGGIMVANGMVYVNTFSSSGAGALLLAFGLR